MIRVCAWCGLFIGVKSPFHAWEVTHGICAPCRARLEGVGVAEPLPPPRALLILSHRAPPGDGPLTLPPEVYATPTAVLWDRRMAEVATRAEYRGEDRRAPGSELTQGWMLVRPWVRDRPSRGRPHRLSA